MPTIKLRGKLYDLHEPVKSAKRLSEIRGETPRQTFHAIREKRFEFVTDGRIIVSTPYQALLPLVGEAGIARLIVNDGNGSAPLGDERNSLAAA
jgi:hypothetical protein